jgi:hypothetical protein
MLGFGHGNIYIGNFYFFRGIHQNQNTLKFFYSQKYKQIRIMQNSYAINDVKQVINATGDIVREDTISVLLTDSRRINNPPVRCFLHWVAGGTGTSL